MSGAAVLTAPMLEHQLAQVLLDPSGHRVLAGSQRLRALQRLGYTYAQAVTSDGVQVRIDLQETEL